MAEFHASDISGTPRAARMRAQASGPGGAAHFWGGIGTPPGSTVGFGKRSLRIWVDRIAA